MTRAAWESPPDSAFSGPALIRPWAMLEFLVNRGWLGLLNTSRAELPKTFAILLMASLVSRDLPPRLQRRASQWPTSLAVIMQRFDGYAALDGGFAGVFPFWLS